MFAVTGHSAGIGQRLYEVLSPSIKGFSRSNGFDITTSGDRARILAAVNDCNIFINSASAVGGDLGQTLLFKELLQQWSNDPSKIIVNVGSMVTEFVLPIGHDLYPYRTSKFALKQATAEAQNNPEIKCRIVYRTFSYVATEKILAKYPHFTEKDYISVDRAVQIILAGL